MQILKRRNNGKKPSDYIDLDFETDLSGRIGIEPNSGMEVTFDSIPQDEGLRPITAHFNDDASGFYKLRKQKMFKFPVRPRRARKRVLNALASKPGAALDPASTGRLDTPSEAPRSSTTQVDIPSRAPLSATAARPLAVLPSLSLEQVPSARPASAQFPTRKSVKKPIESSTILTATKVRISAVTKYVQSDKRLTVIEVTSNKGVTFDIPSIKSEKPTKGLVQAVRGGVNFSAEKTDDRVVIDTLCKIAVENSSSNTVFTVPQGPDNQAVGEALSKAINKKYKDTDKKPTIKGWEPQPDARARSRPRV